MIAEENYEILRIKIIPKSRVITQKKLENNGILRLVSEITGYDLHVETGETFHVETKC